jgi:3-hydroxyisobutyrate dehydrogenase
MPSDVREVVLGPDGVFSGLGRGTYLVDMTTSDPSLAAEIHEVALAHGVQALDAPVTGGETGAKKATLSIMVGGDHAAVDAVRPLLNCMGKTVVHHGGPGFGQRAKLVNQVLIASNMIAVCEGLLFAQKAGLDLGQVLSSVTVGAAGSRVLDGVGESLKTRDFEPGFYVEHFLKDMGLALAEARRLRLCLPGLALANQLYTSLQAQGHGRRGTQAIMLVLEGLSGLTGA